MKLHLLSIHMIMMIFCLMLRIELEDLIMIFFKCGNELPIKNSRYWSTKPHQTKSFNDFNLIQFLI